MGNRLLARAILLVRSAGFADPAHLARHDGALGPGGPARTAIAAIAPIQAIRATGLTGAGPHPARTRGGARGGCLIPGRGQHDE